MECGKFQGSLGERGKLPETEGEMRGKKEHYGKRLKKYFLGEGGTSALITAKRQIPFLVQGMG